MEDSKVAVLLEDLKAQFQVFGEGLQTVIQKTDHLEQRFDGLEKRFDGLELRFDRLEERFDRLEQRVTQHDERFDRLEKRLDRQDERFEQNRVEHRQMMQMIRELHCDAQVRPKRVK